MGGEHSSYNRAVDWMETDAMYALYAIRKWAISHWDPRKNTHEDIYIECKINLTFVYDNAAADASLHFEAHHQDKYGRDFRIQLKLMFSDISQWWNVHRIL